MNKQQNKPNSMPKIFELMLRRLAKDYPGDPYFQRCIDYIDEQREKERQ